MSLEKRIENLETRQGGATRFVIASQDYDNENLFHVSQPRQDESEAMTSDELKAWGAKQGDNVNLLKLVFKDELGLNKLGSF